MPSLARRLAAWAASLRYEELPPEVVDRAKGLTLHGVASALIGHGKPAGQLALQLVKDEERGVEKGATALIDGARLTRAGAAFVNSELIFAGGKLDTFRMLTHPGSAILPAALAAAESEGASGRDYLTGIVAGYEVMERLASDFIPSVMARGFHAGPIFGIFGAAVAAAKVMRLDEDQLVGTIAQCVNLAAGNLEGARAGGASLREGGAVRNALLAVALAKQGMRGSETCLEGPAGFYHAYTGNNRGRLSYVFTGPKTADLDAIAAGLGERWYFLETLYRIYTVAGYDLAHIDVTASLCQERGIRPEDIDRIETVVNWLETLYPSPAFPAPGREGPRPGGTHYYAAWGATQGRFPLLKVGPAADDPPAVLDLMQRVTLVPSKRQHLFAPTVSVYTKDGRKHTKRSTGREFIWDFDEEVRRLADIGPALPIPHAQWQQLVEVCRTLEGLSEASEVVRLTVGNLTPR